MKSMTRDLLPQAVSVPPTTPHPICRVVSFFPTFCFSMSNNAVNLVSN